MAVETEVKIPVQDWDVFLRRLALLQPQKVTERHFEDNYVLDFSEPTLRSQACLLRVRRTNDKATLTFKGPPRASRLFKSREELETRIENADTMLAILERLGFRVWFRYQKYREEYAIAPEGEGTSLQLALDWTPIGDFIELEGTEADILAISDRLGISESQFLRDSYYSLYASYCHQRGDLPGHMVFEAK